MANMKKIPVIWNGLTGLPGISVFYATDVSTNPVSGLNAYFTSLAGKFPSGLSWQLPSAGDTIDEHTGHPTGTWTSTGGGSIAGLGGAVAYAAGTGCRVNWLTAAVTPKFRKVTGHTFMTHVSASQYDVDGTFIATFVTAVQNAATTLVGTGNWLVWHRNSPGLNDGFSAGFTAATVTDRTISIRSRRL